MDTKKLKIQPFVVQKGPYMQELEKGRYFWCACGFSKKHFDGDALCDGAHKGTFYKSLPFEIEEKQTVLLCGCKRTKTPPFCDGSHND